MGEVYRARDIKLEHDVAIKVLPEDFATDPDRLARFEREARLLASLNHPNIAAIYGLEDEGDQQFIVMELVDGKTLADRLSADGCIEVEEALEITRQIAEALEAAHEKGVIHRDLKPANVMLTPGGRIKVLDFGLAKAYQTEGSPASSPDLSDAPTMAAATEAGMILGTPAYMSPEQASGAAVDKRADIWAFGVVLFEMLAGKRLFEGESPAHVLADVLKSEPDHSSLPATTPRAIRRLLRRCLQRKPARRLRDIGDARIELDEAILAPGDVDVGSSVGRLAGRPDWKATAALALVLAAVTTTLGWVLGRASDSAVPSVGAIHFTVPVPEGFEVGVANNPMLALSPDGRTLVYGSNGLLHVRALDRLKSEPLAGTEAAEPPFFSPDGRWIGFVQSGTLRKVSVEGGPVTDISSANVGTATGATWSDSGSIVFALGGSTFGIWRIDAAGGAPEQLTTVDSGALEVYHKWPQLLDGDRLLLFTVIGPSARWEDSKLVVEDLETGDRTTVSTQGTYGRYVPTGHIVYTDATGTLLAVPFDLATASVTGAPFPVASGILTSWFAGSANFAVSDAGTAAFAHGSSWELSILGWMDRDGARQPLGGPMTGFSTWIAPDGARLAVAVSQQTNSDIYLFDAETGERERFTFDPPHDETPVWSPDGGRIAYGAQWTGQEYRLYVKELDAAGAADVLYSAEYHTHISSWSPDGRWLAFSMLVPDHQEDIYVLDVETTDEIVPVVATSALERDARFSPDGRWLAYTSDETGTDEVYAVSFPEAAARKYQVSTAGGERPRWASESNELFFMKNDTLMVTKVIATERQLEWETPSALFELDGSFEDVTADGRRLLVRMKNPDAPVREIHVVLNWLEELKEQAPTPR